MSEISKQPDAYRQRIEREALQIKQAQDRLVNRAVSVLAFKLSKLFGNGKVRDIPQTALNEVEGPTSSVTLFDGTITIKAEVMADNKNKTVEVPVQVKASEFDLNDDDLQQIVTGVEGFNPKEKFEVDSIEPTTIEADLGQFELKDDGDDFYKIYHPALDLGRELTTVAKSEYEKIKNKESLFKDAFENQILGSQYDGGDNVLKFTGSFVEPQIQRTAKDLGTYKKASSSDSEEDVPEEDRLIATMGDTYRQSIEAKERKVQDSKERLINHIINAVTRHLTSLKYSSVKVAGVRDSLQYDGEKFTGGVELKTSLIGSEGPRDVIVPLEVKDDSYKVPRPEAVTDIVAEGTDPRSAIADEIEKETQDRIALIDEFDKYEEEQTEAALSDETSTIKKKAADEGGVQWFGESTTLRLPKQNLNLPDDIELGTVVYADGYHWKLTSKSDGQLSKGANDGSIYTFTKVPVQDTEPEHKLGR